MKNKKTYKILTLILCFNFIFSCIITVSASNEIKLRYIKVNEGKSMYLELGDTVRLKVDYYPKGSSAQTITFSSSKEDIVEVSKTGIVKALKSGTSIITVTADGKKTSVRVTVYENNNLKAKFSENDIVKDKIVNITINVSSKDSDENNFRIFLPTGYMVQGTEASYAADVNGTYPFTVYDSSGKKKTFFYEINSIKNEQKRRTSSDIDNLKINFIYDNFNLKYDYEKKQLLLNANLDSVLEVILPNNSVIETNEVNYYIPNIENGILNDYKFIIDDVFVNCKVVKQGEFYLLMLYQYYNDVRNVYTKNKAYNFAINDELSTDPENLFITDNGTYEVIAYSNSGIKEVFSLPIDNIDYVKPDVETYILYDNTFELKIKDNMSLDYIITYDGNYVDISDDYKANNIYTYKHSQTYSYNGNYLFIVADKNGNRTISETELNKLRNVPYVKKLGPSVHNSLTVENIFKESGYVNDDNTFMNNYYTNIFPSYVKGISSDSFDPNGLITRAQMITILCRTNDLPYDINLLFKTKFTDINNHWATNYICMGSKKKYIQGYRDKTFRPDEYLTRADFCKMICNISTLKSNIASIPSTNNYTYDDINSHYAKADILKLANRDIVTGYNDNFYPNKLITRAEVVYAINRLYKLNPSDDELKHIKSIYEGNYYYNDIQNSKYYDDIIIAIVGMYREK